jgi:hypothetical protein
MGRHTVQGLVFCDPCEPPSPILFRLPVSRKLQVSGKLITGNLLLCITAAGAMVAGRSYPEIKVKYFRIGHMSPTKLGDVLATAGAIEAGLAGC